jgi:Fe-S-cluster containining protein
MPAPSPDLSRDRQHHRDQAPHQKANKYLPPDLIQIVTAALASATARSGAHLACRPGCTQCCVGVFPIAQQDAARLREGLAALTQTDPARAARIRTRVATSLTRLDPWFPGDLATGILSEDDESTTLFEEFANDEVCPVLDPAAGTCDLYLARPILCRTFGPPIRTEDGNLAACELCYTHASTEEIAASALDPAIPALEAASNDAFNATHNLRGETLVAYALRDKQAVRLVESTQQDTLGREHERMP